MRTPLDVEPQTLAAAAGLMTGLSVFGIWLVNPYLALLLAPVGSRLAPGRTRFGPPRAGIVTASPAFAAPCTGRLRHRRAPARARPRSPLATPADDRGRPGRFPTCLLWCGMLGGLIGCIAAAGAEWAVERAARGTRRAASGEPAPTRARARSAVTPPAIGSRAADRSTPIWTPFWTAHWTLVRSG